MRGKWGSAVQIVLLRKTFRPIPPTASCLVCAVPERHPVRDVCAREWDARGNSFGAPSLAGHQAHRQVWGPSVSVGTSGGSRRTTTQVSVSNVPEQVGFACSTSSVPLCLALLLVVGILGYSMATLIVKRSLVVSGWQARKAEGKSDPAPLMYTWSSCVSVDDDAARSHAMLISTPDTNPPINARAYCQRVRYGSAELPR